MDSAVPTNEQDRLKALAEYGIFGTGPEEGFDDLAALAAQFTGAVFSMVNIVGSETVWLKARHGVPAEIREVPRNAVCCARTICQSDLLVCPDTNADERFRDLPFIATDPHLRFYAGMPLIDSGGYALGTLCVLDLQPREMPFETQEALRRLARQVVAQLELRIRLAEVKKARQEIAGAKRRAEQLILNMLPKPIAKELISTGHVEPRHHSSVTTMFTDFAGFTRQAAQLAPRELVNDLNEHFSSFDGIIRRHNLEKIKTIGDAYMCAGGLLTANRHHAVEVCLAALEIRDYMIGANALRTARGMAEWPLRIGIHTGNVMSGIVGKDRPTFDIWGDSVNVAERMQVAGEPGRINVSDTTCEHVKTFFDLELRGMLEVKNRGPMKMHFLNRLLPEFSASADGNKPNEHLRATLAGATHNWSLNG